MKQQRFFQGASRLSGLIGIVSGTMIGLFHILSALIFRLLRVVVGVVYAPLAVSVGTILGYHYGPELAPHAVSLAERGYLPGFSLGVWEWLCKWGGTISLMAVGYVGYMRHQMISKLRAHHELTYWKYQVIGATPGSRLTDFLWSYLTAAVLFNVPVAVLLFCLIGIPWLVTKNLLLRIAIFIFLASGINQILNGSATIFLEAFKPRRLQWEVENAAQIVPQLEVRYQQYLRAKAKAEEGKDEEVETDDW